MNKKYLLRGIGIGLVIASLVMFAAFKTGNNSSAKDNKVTTEAVTTEATTEKQTEATSEEATTEKKTEEKTEATTEEATTEKATEEKTEEATTEKATEEATTEEATTEKTTEETTEAADDKNDSKKGATITISSGMGSEEVSAVLKKAGVIKDDVKYNEFLIENGYESKIIVGTYDIPAGASDKDIAKIITTPAE